MFKVKSEKGSCPKTGQKLQLKSKGSRIQAKKKVSVILTNAFQTLICIQITEVLIKNTDSDLIELEWDPRFYAYKVPGNECCQSMSPFQEANI